MLNLKVGKSSLRFGLLKSKHKKMSLENGINTSLQLLSGLIELYVGVINEPEQ